MTIFVGGFPRSGTTLLMTIFHHYGMDIGYTTDKIQRVIDNNEGALEWFNDLAFYREIDKTSSKTIIDEQGKTHTLESVGIKDPDNYPDVIKHPGDWEKGKSIFTKINLSKCKPPNFAIFCARNPVDVVLSMQKRRRKYREYSAYKMNNILTDMQFNFVRDAEQRNIKWEMLWFPNWIGDDRIFYNSLHLLGLDALKLIKAHKALCRKDRVHFGLE